jgi:hypothetical protein
MKRQAQPLILRYLVLVAYLKGHANFNVGRVAHAQHGTLIEGGRFIQLVKKRLPRARSDNHAVSLLLPESAKSKTNTEQNQKSEITHDTKIVVFTKMYSLQKNNFPTLFSPVPVHSARAN